MTAYAPVLSKMGGRDNIYSQIVTLAKIILPIGAIGLLSTLFLFARAPGETTQIDMTEVTEIAREQRLSAPRFSGVTDDGSVLTISARAARPNPTDTSVVLTDEMQLRMDNPDGSSIAVTTTAGELDGPRKIAHFLGLARLETSTGYTMETSGITAALDTGVITSDGHLEVRTPYGELTAGKVTFQMAESGVAQQMLFTNGVKLIYTPQQ
jgi:lipopolysaccharide export system protein LptC